MAKTITTSILKGDELYDLADQFRKYEEAEAQVELVAGFVISGLLALGVSSGVLTIPSATLAGALSYVSGLYDAYQTFFGNTSETLMALTRLSQNVYEAKVRVKFEKVEINTAEGLKQYYDIEDVEVIGIRESVDSPWTEIM